MIDDERFTPIFRSLVARDIVVLGHQGEPRNAWLPLDEMTVKGDRDYFAEHPQYHMAAGKRSCSPAYVAVQTIVSASVA